MKCSPQCFAALLRGAAFLLVFVVAGCSALAPDSDVPDVITLVNRMDKPLVYLAVERELGSRIDPQPSLEVDAHRERLIQPGASAIIAAEAIMGYNLGDGVRFFLYEVTEGKAKAVLKDVLTLTHEELKQRKFRVEISSLQSM